MEASRPSSPPPATASASEGDKKRWGSGLGGMVRRVTGGEKPGGSVGTGKEKEEVADATGVQVDFYLVIVCNSTRDVPSR
jgi:hypothetical protein